MEKNSSASSLRTSISGGSDFLAFLKQLKVVHFIEKDVVEENFCEVLETDSAAVKAAEELKNDKARDKYDDWSSLEALLFLLFEEQTWMKKMSTIGC